VITALNFGAGRVWWMELRKRMRMRPPVKQIYDRQVARCLSDIDDLFDLPALVIERIKRAIEYTAKDVDKINNKESGHGYEDRSTRN